MLHKPSTFVSPGKVIFVSTFVASTFTAAITPPMVSVTRTIKVAVGPAKRQFVIRELPINIMHMRKQIRARRFDLLTFMDHLLTIRIHIEVCVKEFAARGFGTPARRFNRHNDRVDFS